MRLNKAFDHILRNYGHDVLLQRWTRSGYVQKLERHTCRHWYPATRGLPQTVSDKLEGLVNTVDLIYVFRPDVRPKEKDRIYEKDEGLGQQSIYLIDFALPMRGLHGDVTYWIAGTTREEPN